MIDHISRAEGNARAPAATGGKRAASPLDGAEKTRRRPLIGGPRLSSVVNRLAVAVWRAGGTFFHTPRVAPLAGLAAAHHPWAPGPPRTPRVLNRAVPFGGVRPWSPDRARRLGGSARLSAAADRSRRCVPYGAACAQHTRTARPERHAAESAIAARSGRRPAFARSASARSRRSLGGGGSGPGLSTPVASASSRHRPSAGLTAGPDRNRDV
jgi:hypothetical protein